MTGADIKRLREKLGMTQMQFAVEIGTQMFSVSRWECGRRKPSPLAVRSIRARFPEEAGGKTPSRSPKKPAA